MSALAVMPLRTRRVEQSLVDAAVQAVNSAHSRRVYRAQIERFLLAYPDLEALTRQNVKIYLKSLEDEGKSAQVRNQALYAIKRLVSEAASLELIPQSQAAQAAGIKGRRALRVRSGHWLNLEQLKAVLAAPDAATAAGKRDRAILALLAGCGLRRSELCSLQAGQFTLIGGHWFLVDVKGKGDKNRTLKVPAFAAEAVKAWINELFDTSSNKSLESREQCTLA